MKDTNMRPTAGGHQHPNSVRPGAESQVGQLMYDHELLNWIEQMPNWELRTRFSGDEFSIRLSTPTGIITDTTVRRVLERWRDGMWDQDGEESTL